MMTKKEQHFTIVDKNTYKTIASGIVKNVKKTYVKDDKVCFNIDCISFDNKYYFNKNSSNFLFMETDSDEQFFDKEVLKNYCCEKWVDAAKNNEADIYIEHDITELDKEVISLVSALNKINGIKTIGSCCGHGIYPLYVDLSINEFKALILLAKLITDKFNNDFKITTSPRIVQSDNNIQMSLECNYIGEPAYKKAVKLASYLEILQGI